MDTEPVYPEVVAVADLDLNPEAIAEQVRDVAVHFPKRTRELIFVAAHAALLGHCDHDSANPARPEGLTKAHRKALTDYLAGLCGVFHTGTIAHVVTDDVTYRGEPTGNGYRTQACYEGSVSLNARGTGVQLDRGECFAQACRAVYPGTSVLLSVVQDVLFARR